jgi:hypothetical protein
MHSEDVDITIKSFTKTPPTIRIAVGDRQASCCNVFAEPGLNHAVGHDPCQID